MATNFDQKPITGPFRGIVSSTPKPYIPPNAFDDLVNFFIYRGRLLTRNKSVAFSTAPDGANIYELVAFNDILQNPHNLALTAKNAYMLTSGPTWNGPLQYQTWDPTVTYAQNDVVVYLGTIYSSLVSSNTNNAPSTSLTQWAGINPSLVNTGLPYNYELSAGRVYYANGSMPGTYTDGEATIKSMMHPGSFYFIGQLGQHMITCYTIEPSPGVPGSTAFPTRVRWSDVGNPTSWAETASSTAGHNDLIDVPDAITGYLTQGRTGYVYRSNGITMMTPTGIGAAPFQFDQVTHAPKGVGNFYSYSQDVFGTMSVFASEDDIYTFDSSTFAAIGADARDLIFADISASPANQVIGTILVRFNAQFLLMSYWLALPTSADGVPVVWIYFFDTKGWARFTTSVGTKRVTTVSQLVI